MTTDGNRQCTQEGFTFFEITNVNKIALAKSYSGILGIAPDDPSNGPSFVATLKSQGQIRNKMIGLLLQK
jgi:Eukaryotic aspartyl protease